LFLNLADFPWTYWSLGSQSQPSWPSLCHVSQSFKNRPSARCATAASSVCSDTDGFRKQSDHTNRFKILLVFIIIRCPKQLLKYSLVFWFVFVSCMSCLMSFVIWVFALCCFCYWASVCWLSKLINNKWIKLLLSGGIWQLHVECIAHLPTWMQRSPLIVPGLESLGSVAPNINLPVFTIFRPSQT